MMKSSLHSRTIPKCLFLSCLLLGDYFATGFQLSYNLRTIHNGLITPNDNAFDSMIDSSSTTMTLLSPPTSSSLGWSTSCNRHTNSRVGTRILSIGDRRRRSRSSTDLSYGFRDADHGEVLAGGQRYQMVELPDSMVDTTIFVGNLCEVSTESVFIYSFCVIQFLIRVLSSFLLFLNFETQ